MHKKIPSSGNCEIPAWNGEGKDGAPGMLESNKDSAGVKLLAIMSDHWLHMFLLNVFRFTGGIGLKYYRIPGALIKINCVQDTCSAGRLSSPGRALHEREVSGTTTNWRNESARGILPLVSKNKLKCGCYLRSAKGKGNNINSNTAEFGCKRQSSSLKIQTVNEHRWLRPSHYTGTCCDHLSAGRAGKAIPADSAPCSLFL